MRKITLLKIGFMLVLCGLLAVSCGKGGSGGDDPTPTPTPNPDPNPNPNPGGNETGEYKLTFDVNGATGSIQAIDFKTETKLPDASVLTYDKHIFLGWSTDKNAATPEYEAGSTYKGKTATLYAVWTEVFKITYNYNDAKKTSEFTALDFSQGKALIQCNVEIKENELLVWKDKDGNSFENGAKAPKAADLELAAEILNKVSGGATSEEWQYKDYFNN